MFAVTPMKATPARLWTVRFLKATRTQCWKPCRPIIRNNTGGLSGPALLPIAVRMVYQAAQRVKIPIVGMGGVSKWQDAVELLLAGASALQIGTAFFTDPYVPVKILDGLNQYLDHHKIENVTELTGKVEIW